MYELNVCICVKHEYWPELHDPRLIYEMLAVLLLLFAGFIKQLNTDCYCSQLLKIVWNSDLNVYTYHKSRINLNVRE